MLCLSVGAGVSAADSTPLPTTALARLLGAAFKPGRGFGAKHWSKCIFTEIQMQSSQTFTPTFQLSCRLFFQGHPLAYPQDCGNAVKAGAIFLCAEGTQSLCCGYLLPGSQRGELSSRECSGADWGSLAVPCAAGTCLCCQGCADPQAVDNGVKGHSGSLQGQLEPVKSSWSGHHPVSFLCVFKGRDCSASLGCCPG